MALLTPYWGLDGILILASLTVAVYLYFTRNFKYWQKRGILEIPPTPIMGNFLDCFLMKKTAGEFVKDLYDSAKGLPYMGFYIFDKPFFLARDPELVKHILVKDFQYFSDRYASASVKDRLGYANLFLIKNPAWKVLRAKITPIFTSGKLKKMFELMLDVANDLDVYLEKLSLDNKGKVLECKELCANFTTDMIATTAYGLKVDSLNNPQGEFRSVGRNIFTYNFFRGFELLSIFFMPRIVETMKFKFFGKEASEFLRRVFWDTINHRIQSGTKRNDLIDLLIELKQNHENDEIEGFNFDGDDLVAQAAVFFTGGFETTSTTISFSLYELALNTEVQGKLRQEILDALEETNGKITYEMTMNLPYLDMVISETLRKYPPLPFLDRVAGSNYKVPNSDLVLEKGTPVYISMIGMHYDPEFYPDPEKFDPDRFTEENKRKRPACVYFPFGEGPHICIGLRLGLMQSKLGLIEILRKYEVTPCDKTVIPVKMNPKGLTTTALHGLYLNFRKIVSEAA